MLLTVGRELTMNLFLKESNLDLNNNRRCKYLNRIFKMRAIFVMFLSIALLSACKDEYFVHYYIHNASDEKIFIYSSIVHGEFCAHKDILDSLNVSETLKGEIESDYEEWFDRCDKYVFIFKKSTLDKYSVEEIESKKIYDTLYVFNGLDCKNNKNNNVVFTGK